MKIRYYKDDGTVYHLKTLTGSERSEFHWHNNIEIIYVVHGCIRLAIRKKSFDVKKGDIAIINSGDHHTYHNGYVLEKGYDTEIRICSFSPIIINTATKSNKRHSFITSSADIDASGIRKAVESAMDGIENEQNNPGEFSDILIRSYITQLYYSLLKTYNEKEESGTTVSAEYEKLFPDFNAGYDKNAVGEKTMEKFQTVLDYTNINFSDPELSLTVLSKVSGLSECYISELFPVIIGIRFKQFLNTLRVNYALQLLSSKSIKISDAAYASGFETIRSFNAVFKKLKGVTPSEFLNGVTGKSNAPSITTGFKNITLNNLYTLKNVYGNYCKLMEAENPENTEEKVIYLKTTAPNKAWTSLNIGMLFQKGATYQICANVYFLDDFNNTSYSNNTIGINLYYAEGSSEPKSHSIKATSGASGSGWHRIECTAKISDDYTPGLHDKFSVFGNPVNGAGISFLVNNLSCYQI